MWHFQHSHDRSIWAGGNLNNRIQPESIGGFGDLRSGGGRLYSNRAEGIGGTYSGESDLSFVNGDCGIPGTSIATEFRGFGGRAVNHGKCEQEQGSGGSSFGSTYKNGSGGGSYFNNYSSYTGQYLQNETPLWCFI